MKGGKECMHAREWLTLTEKKESSIAKRTEEPIQEKKGMKELRWWISPTTTCSAYEEKR